MNCGICEVKMAIYTKDSTVCTHCDMHLDEGYTVEEIRKKLGKDAKTMPDITKESLLDRTDVAWDAEILTFANTLEDLVLFCSVGDFPFAIKRKQEAFNQFLARKKLDDTILDTIIDLHRRANAIGGIAPQLAAQIEILRFVRNTSLGQSFEEGLHDEKMYLLSKENEKKDHV